MTSPDIIFPPSVNLPSTASWKNFRRGGPHPAWRMQTFPDCQGLHRWSEVLFLVRQEAFSRWGQSGLAGHRLHPAREAVPGGCASDEWPHLLHGDEQHACPERCAM